MFQEFDNEIIWTAIAIFERGYDENGNYSTENTINYLLELKLLFRKCIVKLVVNSYKCGTFA